METLKASDFISIFVSLEDTMTENKELLTKMDAAVGDGDLGITMSKGFHAANRSLQNLDENNIGQLLIKAGISISQAAPSTMGTLIGSGFMSAGKVVFGKLELNLSDFVEAMGTFVNGIIHRGKAELGDKTVVDSLYPAYQTLQIAVKEGKNFKEAVQLAYKASLDGLESTRSMIPQHGKQVAHRDNSHGLQDPGATVGMLIIRTFARYLNQ